MTQSGAPLCTAAWTKLILHSARTIWYSSDWIDLNKLVTGFPSNPCQPKDLFLFYSLAIVGCLHNISAFSLCIGEIRGILICNSFVVLILQPSCFCPRQSALGPSGAKMRRSRFCVAYFEEPVMSVLESGLKSKTWLWSQQAVVEKNWDASHVVCLPQCDQTADWGRFSSTAMIAVHTVTCTRTQSNKHRECCILFVCSADKCFAAKTLNVFAGRRD